jgi:hypothetical protein
MSHVVVIAPPLPTPKWSLCVDGHVISATIIDNAPRVEVHILLDGQPLYNSRHATREAADAELLSLRGFWTREGWIDAA